MKKLIFLFTGLVYSSFFQPAAVAENWPNKPITWVVGYAAGGGTDVVARMIADRVSANLGQPMVVENRPGGGGIIGVQHVLNAAADGYTFFFASDGEITINPNVRENLPYDPSVDLVPVTLIADVPIVVCVPKESSIHSISDLIQLAKDGPGSLKYGVPNLGSPHHLSVELFQMMTGTRLQVVPYQKTPQAVGDLVAGRLDVSFLGAAPASKFIESGDLRLIAVASKERLDTYPDVPTVAETVGGYQASAWWGIVAKAGTPDHIINQMSDALVLVTQDEAISGWLKKITARPLALGPDEFKEYIQRDLKKWKLVADRANIRIGG